MPPGRSRVLAVLGDPVDHSLSPAMHNAAIAALGLDAVYVAFRVRVDDLPQVLTTCRLLGIAGNCTVPLKLRAADLVTSVSPLARQLGAVNTFVPDGDGLAGDNTDVAGVLDAVDALAGDGPWVVAGTGGAARAVAAAAAGRGVALLVRSRSAERADTFVAWARDLAVEASVDDGRPAGTVINATPLGLEAGDAAPVPEERLRGCRAALDLVYRPGETAWVRAARAAGLRAADGRRMLVGQGARAFERFFPGTVAPREVMLGAVRRVLGE